MFHIVTFTLFSVVAHWLRKNQPRSHGLAKGETLGTKMDAVRVNLILVPRAYDLLVSGWITRVIILNSVGGLSTRMCQSRTLSLVSLLGTLEETKGERRLCVRDWVRVVVRVKKRLRV